VQFKLDMRNKAARAAFGSAPAEFHRHLHRGYQEIGDAFVEATNDRISRKWTFRNKTNRLSRRSGDLARSLDSRMVGSGEDMRLVVTIGDSRTAKYVWMQEEGDTIRPVKGKFLTIPQPDNLTPGGRVRYPSARDLMGTGRTYRKGRAIFLRTGLHQTDNDPMLWALVKSVTIKPRLKFRSTWLNSTSVDKMRRAKLQEAVAGAIEAIQRGSV